MDIYTIKKMEKEAIKGSRFDFIRLGLALLFIAMVFIYSLTTSGGIPNSAFLSVAALFGAYMAMNIGANDVANNVGPAVGSKALTMGGAIAIAAIFEAGGAFIAGGDVIKTIKKGIIDISMFGGNTDEFIYAMMAALLAAALWLNFATYLKAPVSTTHSIVGGVMGAGIAAAGFSIVAWGTMGKIAASWVISPLLGGVIAALFLYSIKISIIHKKDKINAASKWVPVFIAIMSWAFMTYLTLKGLKKIWPKIVDIASFLPHDKKPTFLVASVLGLIIASIVYILVKSAISKKIGKLENTRAGINALFTIPLIFAAALLSFAHGANDVANAIGPLAAISDAVMNGGISGKASIPFWVLGVGALGIAIGLALYGPKLIRTVGSEITELDQIRAFSVAMAAAITVIIASQLGLPVSSTHIAIGGIFGVGFLREYLDSTTNIQKIEEKEIIVTDEKKQLKILHAELSDIESREDKAKDDYERIVELYSLIEAEDSNLKVVKKDLKNAKKKKYVKRDAIKKIIAAWIITVPAAATLSALIYFTIRGVAI